MTGNLAAINHIVVLMLENRSFDHMLGYLYPGKKTPGGQAFEGLSGTESNEDDNGNPIQVFPITATTPNTYFMPCVNPGESYSERNVQLFGNSSPPAAAPPASATNIGYVKDFIGRIAKAPTSHQKFIGNTAPSAIMGCFSPETLPVLSGLAKGYAVCDQWFASVPSETMPNRAFALAGTSLGEVNDPYGQKTVPTFNTPSIFGRLADAGKQWRIYGAGTILTANNFPDTMNKKSQCLSLTQFKNDARTGALPEFSFIEPAWSGLGQNDQHPVSDVSAGEQLIADVYYALFHGPAWNSTLLIITYDECGGCYDHVAPPWGGKVVPPDSKTDPKYGFAFNRLGPRVPAVLVSPLIEAGTVFRLPEGAAPLEHTAIIKTVATRWGLPKLTARDDAASDLGGVLTLTTARTDDPIANVQVPHYSGENPFAADVTHIQELTADALEGKQSVKDAKVVGPRPTNSLDFENYIRRMRKHS